ncbi:MAG: type II secretion system protein, partial [Meiothermus silvanus]|nr:type II secretion system protein [Allomeiothermus silvanus]
MCLTPLPRLSTEARMRSKGFTLFELLVAMALVGLIFTAFLQVFT